MLEAFDTLRRRYPRLRLTIRCALPRLDDRYLRMIDSGWVRVIDRFLPANRMEELLRQTHVYLLPAARIHIVSVLQAMSYGQAVVVSDGWGMDEYVEHGRNGLIVAGRAGKVSWADREVGMLREHYGLMYVRRPGGGRGTGRIGVAAGRRCRGAPADRARPPAPTWSRATP